MATKVLTDTDILNRIGNTPLVKLESLSNGKVNYFAKLESHNPFGSVKDRAAYWMIKDAEEKGRLKRGETIIIEPTSGNFSKIAGVVRLTRLSVHCAERITATKSW